MPRRGALPSTVPGATFPLPDWLAAASSRPALSLSEFSRSVVAKSPILPLSDNAAEPSSSEQSIQQTTPSECDPEPPVSESPQQQQGEAAALAAVRVAALQRVAIGVDAAEPVPPREPPTFAEILSGLRSSSDATSPGVAKGSEADDELGDRVFVEVAVYDAEAPTKSVHLRLPALAPLTQLIDAVPCSAVVVDDDAVREMRTTAVVYVNGVLYVDSRFGDADYSTPVARFLGRHGVRVRTVRLEEESTRLLDLVVQIGVPYVFVHRGDCEHLLIFTDVYKDYARGKGEGRETEVLWRRYPRVVPCDVCGVRYAEKFTISDRLAESCPFHYCGACYKLAHYSRSGELFDSSGEFLVYSHPAPL